MAIDGARVSWHLGTTSQRRTVRVQSADACDGSGGSPVLVAYGYRWIAEQAGTTPGAVRSAVCRGELELEDPRSVCAWLDRREAKARRGEAKP